MPQCIHGFGWDGIGPNTCPQCNTPDNLKAFGASGEKYRIAAQLRTWAGFIEEASKKAPVRDDASRVKVLRDAADSIERGEEAPTWAR